MTLLASHKPESLRPVLPAGWTPAAAWAALREALSRRLSPAHAALFAEPVAGAAPGTIGWTADGAARRFYDLDAPSRDALKREIGRVVSDIRRLGEEDGRNLKDRDAALPPLLAAAVEIPGWDYVHAVAGRPVLAAWGHVAPGASAPRGILRALDDGVAWTPPPRRPWPVWAATAAVLLLLLLATPIVVRTLPWGALLDPPLPVCRIDEDRLRPLTELEEHRERGRALQSQLASLRLELAGKQAQCPLPEPPPQEVAAVPLPSPPPPRPPRREPAPQLPAEPAPTPPLDRDCLPVAGSNEPPPHVVMILDTSGSMGFARSQPASQDEVVEHRLRREALGRIFLGPAAMERVFDRYIDSIPPSERRITHAKRALTATTDRLPPGVSASLVTFGRDRCTVVSGGTFADGQRGALRGAIESSQADAVGTPLAQAIRTAKREILRLGGGRPARVVLVTDGVESCHGDPCAAAREFHAQLPDVAIHVVDIAGNPALRCIADATGGALHGGGTDLDLTGLVQKAAGQAASCIGPGSPPPRASPPSTRSSRDR
jgi:hypothetical protein